MTPPSSPPRSPSPICEWPIQSVTKRNQLSTVEKVRAALEKCGITNEHAVNALMEIIEAKNE